jgi:leucyl aminopeptidase (aminopeptidase T)
VQKGKVTSVNGGIEAEKMRKLLKSDENASHIAEFAIGTNPNSRMKGNMAEDKVLRGCVHIAVGDNHTIGGTLESKIHLDGVILNPIVEMDDSILVNKGVLLPLD